MIILTRKSSLTFQKCKNRCNDNVYTDEFSEKPRNSDVEERGINPLTEIFRIIQSKIDEN